MSNKNDTVTEALVRDLGKYLKTAVPELSAVYDDFPSANQQLDMPCATIYASRPLFTTMMPYVVAKGAKDDQNRALVTRVFGQWDVTLQLDLWCKTKLERHELFQKLVLALNPNISTSGLSLQLMDYHAQWARFDMGKNELVDSEQASQRGEWRVRIDVVANVKACKVSLDYLIVEIENKPEVSHTVVVSTDEDDGGVLF